MEKLNEIEDYLLGLISSIDMNIVSQMSMDVVVGCYRLMYFMSVALTTILAFIRMSDEWPRRDRSTKKKMFYYTLVFLGMGFAGITVVQGVTLFPISTFLISVGANRYWLSKEVDVLEIIKKDYRQ